MTAVLGASAGHGALVAPMSDFSVMSSHAAIFTAGPPVVLRVARGVGHEGGARRPVGRRRERPDPQRGGGRRRRPRPRAQRTSRYFPSSAWSYPPDAAGGDTEPRLVPEMLDIVPRNGRQVYEMREVIDVVFDRASCVRGAAASSGKSVVCALARLGGHPVAVVANQPRVAGRVRGRRRRRQGRALHHRRRLLPSPARLPRRQPGRHARSRVGAAGHPAQRRAHVRGADARDQRRSSR